MKTYAIAVYYRFDGSYLERYDRLLKLLATYPDVWMEAPSLFILRTDERIGVVEGKARAAGFQPGTDIILVIDVTGQEAMFAGQIEHLVQLQRMLPAVIPVPAKKAEHPSGTSVLESWRALAGGKPMQAGFLKPPQPEFGFKGFRRPT